MLTHRLHIVRTSLQGNGLVRQVELCVAKVNNFQQIWLGNDHVFRPKVQVEDVLSVQILHRAQDLPEIVSDFHLRIGGPRKEEQGKKNQ